MSKLKLTNITLKTENDKEVTLTIEEAKELFKQLQDLFGDKTKVVTLPSGPVIIDRDRYPWRPYGPSWTYVGDTTTAKIKSGDSSFEVSYHCENQN